MMVTSYHVFVLPQASSLPHLFVRPVHFPNVPTLDLETCEVGWLLYMHCLIMPFGSSRTVPEVRYHWTPPGTVTDHSVEHITVPEVRYDWIPRHGHGRGVSFLGNLSLARSDAQMLGLLFLAFLTKKVLALHVLHRFLGMIVARLGALLRTCLLVWCITSTIFHVCVQEGIIVGCPFMSSMVDFCVLEAICMSPSWILSGTCCAVL